MARRPSAARLLAWLATLLALAGFAYMWFSPTGMMCTDAGGKEICHATTIASSLGPFALVAVLILSAGFAAVPAAFVQRTWVQFLWLGVIVLFFLVSFGVDLPLLPASAAAGAGAALRTHT